MIYIYIPFEHGFHMLSCILHYIARLDCRGGSHDERQTIAGFNSQNLALPTDSVQASYLPRAGGGVVCSCPIYGNFGGENVKIWTHTHLLRNIIANFCCGVHRSCTDNPYKLT
jgi:hypothetical protein